MSNLSDFFGASGTIASIQRGTTTVTPVQGVNDGTATSTATINSVVAAKTIINTSVANGYYSRYTGSIGLGGAIDIMAVLTNATTITFTCGKGQASYLEIQAAQPGVISWEVIEYV